MILSDIEIRKAILDGDFLLLHDTEPEIKSASICLHLSGKIMELSYECQEVDVRKRETYPKYIEACIDPSDGYLLSPGAFLLGATLESISLSNSLAGHLSNISGLARLGLNTILSSYISPGFGESIARPLTLELHNASTAPVRIFPGMRVCHLLLIKLGDAAACGYDQKHPGKYLVNSPQGSEYYKNTGLVIHE